jgi:predicted RecA/RadA family phage recombinase
MATTTSARITRSDSDKVSIPVGASTKVPQNGLVFRNSSGYGVNIVASGANPLVGLAVTEVDNSSGSAGDLNVDCYSEGVFTLGFAGASLTQADVMKTCYATDNDTLTLTSTSRTPVGQIVEVLSATSARVKLVTNGAVAA